MNPFQYRMNVDLGMVVILHCCFPPNINQLVAVAFTSVKSLFTFM